MDRRIAAPVAILSTAIGLAVALVVTRPEVEVVAPDSLTPLVRVAVVEPGVINVTTAILCSRAPVN